VARHRTEPLGADRPEQILTARLRVRPAGKDLLSPALLMGMTLDIGAFHFGLLSGLSRTGKSNPDRLEARVSLGLSGLSLFV
jgi:hypothetical protein